MIWKKPGVFDVNRVRKQVGCPDAVYSRNHGETVTAAVLDTGVALHPDLGRRIIGFRDFIHHRQAVYDDSGHGTHVCGILAGDGALSKGRFQGMAPMARLVVGKILNQNGEGCVENMLEGIDWILSVQAYYHIRILNISVGVGELRNKADKEELIKAIERAWDKGLVVIAAAGNTGPAPMSISPIGASKKVITVGCHDGGYFGKRESICENYSGRGPSEYAFKKPDIVAPGTDIVSCCHKCRKHYYAYKDAYTKKSGTSMATPIVSGAAALLLQKSPSCTNEMVKSRLIYTATDMKEPWSKQGWGMIDVNKLLEG